jgi:hypothetical protein
MSHEPAGHHIGAVADARGAVADGGGGNAEPLEVIETGDAGLVAPDPGVIEDRRGDAQLAREIGGIDAAVRTVDDDGTRSLALDAGDAVGGQDRRKLRQRSLPSIGDPVIMQGNSGGEQAGTKSLPELSFFCRARKTQGEIAFCAKRFSDSPFPINPLGVSSDGALRDRQRKSDGSRDVARLARRAGRLGASGGLLPIILALLLAPGRTLLHVERAVVIGIDLVKALAIDRVAFRLRHRRQLIVISLAPLDARLFGGGQAGGRQLPRQPRLALCQITQPKIAVLLEGDRFARGGLRCRGLCCGGLCFRALCGGRQMPPRRRNEGGNGDR